MDIIESILRGLIKIERDASVKYALRKLEKEFPGISKAYFEYLKDKDKIDAEWLAYMRKKYPGDRQYYKGLDFKRFLH